MSFGRRKIPKRLILDDYYQQKRGFGYGWLLLAALVLILSMLVSLKVQADTIFDEAETGQLLLKNDAGLSEPSLHLRSQADAVINGMIAKVTLSQVFSNHSDEWREGVYVFPLPENAAVNHMQMRIGERVIIGEIKEKIEALKIYQEAKDAGKRAALTEQLRPNMFTQRVANIAPQEEVEISITYIQRIDFSDGEFSWRMPMTITPRFFPSQSTEDNEFSLDLKKNIDFDDAENFTKYLDLPDIKFASLGKTYANTTNKIIDIGEGWILDSSAQLSPLPLPASLTQFLEQKVTNPMRLSVKLNSGLPLADIQSPFHQVTIKKQTQGHSIAFANTEENMDRDFVLRWRPTASASPKAAIFSEEVDNEYYSLLMLLPPQKKVAEGERLARDMVFIIDVSGSMSGTSIEQAKAGLISALDRLSGQDRFNIIAFSSEFSAVYPRLQDADPRIIERAKRWVSSLASQGGTNMLPALNFAFDQYSPSHALQQTVFITDGAVGNETQLFKTIGEKIGDSRLFTVGIGSAPNSYFMRKAAEFGRGTFTHIGNIHQVGEKIDALFAKLDSAVAKSIQVNWPGNVTIYPEKIPDLYLSEPLLIAAKSSDLKGIVNITGETALMQWQQKISLTSFQNAEGISSVWARAKIEDLEDLKISGGNTEVIKSEIIEVALRHKLLSHYTSFVAVEQRISRPQASPLESTALQNALPAGFQKTTRAVAYPATATTAEITWWLGLFCAVIFVIYLRMTED